MQASWAMIFTAPNAEHIVARELRERRDEPHHFFKRKIKRVRRGVVHDWVVPAFPRYIFTTPETGWALKYEMPMRVVDVVRSRVDGMMWLVPDVEIAKLIERCEGGDILPSAKEADPYQHGDEVIIIGSHAAAGHRAVYQHMLGDNHALVLFNWLGRMVPTDVDLRDISRLKPEVDKNRCERRQQRKGSRHRRKKENSVA